MDSEPATDELLDRVTRRALGSGPILSTRVHLQQRGQMRLEPDKPWLPFQAEQVIWAKELAFRWRAKTRLSALVSAQIIDAFEDGHGRLTVKLWGLLPVARSRGPEIDRGEVLRYLAELPWCPPAYRSNPDLRARAVGENQLELSALAGASRETLLLSVNDDGDVQRVRAAARPRLVGKQFVDAPWTGVYSDHACLGGLRVPRRAVVTWDLEEGPFECFRGEIVSLRVE